VTAANKRRASEKVKLRQNFSGKLLESYIVSTDRKVNDDNFSLIEKFWRERFGAARPAEDTRKGLIFRDVDVERIEDFLIAFKTHSDATDRKSDIVAYLRALAGKHPRGDVLLISPGGIVEDPPYTLNVQERAVEDLSGSKWHLNKDRVASRGDEKLGLSEPQKAAAEAAAAAEGVSASDTHYREVRKKPLLMIHSLQPKRADVQGPIAAFGVSFPPGHYDTEIEVVVNRIWLQQMQGVRDDPDDEDDYDA
jgi:hypothetical protein